MQRHRPAVLLLLILAALMPGKLPAEANQADMAPSSILVARVSGVVTVSDPETGQFRSLTRGMRLGQGVTINSAADGTAILLFSNGSTLTVKANTQVAIDEYLQAPAPEESPAQLESRDAEPSTSKTRLRLLEGDIVGSVKRLNTDEGSSFEINSPIGTAGIRGTSWSMSVRITQDGATGSFGIAVGNGFFIPLGGAEQLVGTGVEVMIGLSTDADGNPVITSLTAEGLDVQLREQITLDTEAARQAFQEFTGQEFSSLPGFRQLDIGGENNQQITENRERARPNRPADRVTPTQGEGSSTSGPDSD